MLFDKTMEQVKIHSKTGVDLGYNIFFTALQGSQNYGLEYESSDVDTKTLIIPKLDEIILNKKPVSTTFVLEDNSHDDHKDIRLMFQNFIKQNINFLEVLFTKYYVVNPLFLDEFTRLRAMADEIALIDRNKMLSAIAGMSMEKFKAIQHPYPACIQDIEIYGYSPKQYHHILRLNRFIKDLVNEIPFRECLISRDREYLLEAKRGNHNFNGLLDYAKSVNQETYNIYKNNISNNDEVRLDIIEKMNNIMADVIKKSLKQELCK